MEEAFNQWGVVELFGHMKIAGLLSEEMIAGAKMLRVDVPETDKSPAFTKYYGGSAIYAINITSQEIVMAWCSQNPKLPIYPYEISGLIEKYKALEPGDFTGENI